MNALLLTLLEKLSNHISLFLVIETRIAASFMIIFFFRREWCPPGIVICLSLLLGYFVLNSMGDSLLFALDTFYNIMAALVNQFFLGIFTGLIINLFVEFFIGFGQVISMQIGLGFVNFFVPRVGTITPLTQFFILLSTVIFLELNAHLVLIKMILKTFLTIPVLPSLNGQLIFKLLDYTSFLFQGIVMLSLAIMFSIMVANITLGLLTKFSPQINIFSVGINIVLLLCFFILYVSFDSIVENGNILCNDLLLFIRQFLL